MSGQRYRRNLRHVEFYHLSLDQWHDKEMRHESILLLPFTKRILKGSIHSVRGKKEWRQETLGEWLRNEYPLKETDKDGGLCHCSCCFCVNDLRRRRHDSRLQLPLHERILKDRFTQSQRKRNTGKSRDHKSHWKKNRKLDVRSKKQKKTEACSISPAVTGLRREETWI